MMPRYAPAIPLPPYSYVPGHEHPHPVTDPRGHSFRHDNRSGAIAPMSGDQLSGHVGVGYRGRAEVLAADPQWLHAIDLFNAGFYWEAHEAWERFWNDLGRATPEARFIQGLIHLAAAAVKLREGKPAGVASHTQRAWERLGGSATRLPCDRDDIVRGMSGTLGLAPLSLAAVLIELSGSNTECWHTSRTPVVRVLVNGLCLDPPPTPSAAGEEVWRGRTDRRTTDEQAEI